MSTDIAPTPKEGKNKEGRKTKYSQEIADEICDRIINGESVSSICRDERMPTFGTVWNWLNSAEKQGHEFFERYARARAINAERMFENLQELAAESDTVIVGNDKSDNARVSAKKLRVDTLKWILSKMIPQKYGDKLDLTSKDRPIPLLANLEKAIKKSEEAEKREE